MRIKVVFHYLGLLMVVLGVTMLFPLGWGLYHGETTSSAFVLSTVISVGAGLALWRLTPNSQGRFSRREAILLVTGVWIVASLIGALPYYLAGVFPNYVDAFFEAMSGYTTTGATVLTSIETQTQSILLWRNFTQWFGGMGIITLFVALFPLFGMGAAHLVDAELPGPQTEKLTARIRDTVKSLWSLYIGFTILEFILLWLAGGIPKFDALILTFGTMPTGGFAATTLSVGAYNSVVVEGIVTAFMVIAGVNFGLHYLLLWKRHPGHLFSNPEFRLYAGLLIGATVIISVNLHHVMALPIGEALRHGAFQTASIMTTTGFSTVDFNAWPSLSRAILLMLMIVGASAGSTGGALKVTRFMVLCKYAFRQISLAFNPKSVIPIKIGDTVLSSRVVSGILGMAGLYLGTIVVGFLIMSAMGLNNITALSSVLATLGNVGPGLDAVGPAADYAFLSNGGKIVLSFLMLAGRLEILTVFTILAPSFWKWR